MADSIKLVYFDLRGRGEVARLVLTAGGQKFEDVRVPFGSNQWKPDAPYGQLPYLVYNGKKYGQSTAIAGFFAKEFGLYGKSHVESMRIDEVVGLVGDFMQIMVKSAFESDEAKKAELTKKLLEEDIPKYLTFLENLLKDNGSKGFYAGINVSLADFEVFNITDSLLARNADVLKTFPEISKMRSKVSEHPKIKAYLASRKASPM